MIDLRPLIQPSFWFTMQAPDLSPFFQRGFFIGFAVLAIAGAVIRMVARRRFDDKFVTITANRVGAMLATVGVLGLAWLFFAFEGIYLFGSRMWVLLLAAGAIYWLYTIAKYWRVEVPAARARQASQQEANKYLPRRAR